MILSSVGVGGGVANSWMSLFLRGVWSHASSGLLGYQNCEAFELAVVFTRVTPLGGSLSDTKVVESALILGSVT